MPNRAARRVRHRLIPWPKRKPLPIRGLVWRGGQKAWTCSCGSGWMTMTTEDPAEAHAAHAVAALAPTDTDDVTDGWV